MELDSDEESTIEEDFYTFLNISRDASKEDINNAYRRLSRQYHPDKHLDPEKKAKAEILFNRTKKAYEILSDPHQRAIYDNLGVKGLETEGWEIVQRTKTPAEIRAEYEQLAEEKAERQKQRRTNPHGMITIDINATDLFNPYETEILEDLEIEPSSSLSNIEISGMQFTQSVEFPLTQKDTCTLAGNLSTHNGNGNGGVNCSWRHVFSHKSWAELEIGAGNGPTFSLKAFRTLSQRFFLNGGTVLQFTPQGVQAGIMSTLAMQIDKHSVGYLTYHGGNRSLISTSIMRDTEYAQYNFAIKFGLPHSSIIVTYTKKMLSQELKLRLSVKLGTFGGVFEYGLEKKVSKHSTVTASVAVGIPTGVKLKIRLARANQIYSFPIHLCEEVLPAPVFYATVLPVVVYIIVKKGIVEPFRREQQALKAERQRETNREKLTQKRREAQAAVELMSATYARILEEEDTKKGLIIVKAFYGKGLTTTIGARLQAGNGHSMSKERLEEIIDVTIALQCLVKDSKLVLHELSKSQLPGFFDPAAGDEKQLYIIYNYKQQAHEVLIEDTESLRIPKSSHKVSNIT